MDITLATVVHHFIATTERNIAFTLARQRKFKQEQIAKWFPHIDSKGKSEQKMVLAFAVYAICYYSSCASFIG